MSWWNLVALSLVLLLLLVACTAPDDAATGDRASPDPTTGGSDPRTDGTAGDGRSPAAADPVAEGATTAFAPPPDLPEGPTSDAVTRIADRIVANPLAIDHAAVGELGAAGDPRALWLVSDLLRLAASVEDLDAAIGAAEALSDLQLRGVGSPWVELTDHLIAWDLPATDGYREHKAGLFTALEPGWQPFFDDDDADIDWRLVSWGGVLIDDRQLGDPNPCLEGCIPALDDPALVPAAEGGWYPDDGIVFGVAVGEEAVAFPRNLMEVHEMVNVTIGGQRLAIPYCTLCGAAQAFATDGSIVMRTSGLLHRSNKVMYDLTTQSVFDTFTAVAVSGPLQDQQVALDQVPVVTTTWEAWRDAHPATTIVAEDGGIGRRYPADPLGGRDDDGPIFPIGDRDERLGVHDQVLGVVLDDGSAVAFPVVSAQAALAAGLPVQVGEVAVVAQAGGLVATAGGDPLPSHQAFWFAWSQFHPDTALWEPS